MKANDTNQDHVKLKNANHIIRECFLCKSIHIVYDSHQDIIYCYDCGLILRQCFDDFTPNMGIFPSTNKSKFKRII